MKKTPHSTLEATEKTCVSVQPKKSVNYKEHSTASESSLIVDESNLELLDKTDMSQVCTEHPDAKYVPARKSFVVVIG